MMLEAAQHGDNAFATLTYNDENLPEDLSVSPKTLSVFIRALRDQGYKFRFFGCGEYGDLSGRAHYHVALFGFQSCLYGITRKRPDCCRQCAAVQKAWGRGNSYLGTLERKSIQYIAGYINKKMTKHSDPRLEGRLPEFARMSLRPGIGYGMMHELASTLMEYELDKKLIDVPVVLAHDNNKQWPLGRYLRRSLRKMIGRSPNTPKEALDEYKAQMQPLREIAFMASKSLKSEVLAQSLGKRIQIEARAKRNKKDVL